MPNDEKDRAAVIPVDLIRETVMPPYEYQRPQHGFGSTSTEPNAETGTVPDSSVVTTEER